MEAVKHWVLPQLATPAVRPPASSTSGPVPLEDVIGRVAWIQDPVALLNMSDGARLFLLANGLVEPTGGAYLDRGLAGVAAVFLFDLARPSGPRRQAWVVWGDVPGVVLFGDEARTGIDALRLYVAELERWVQTASRGVPPAGLDRPTTLVASPEAVAAVRAKLPVLTDQVIPWLEDWSPADE